MTVIAWGGIGASALMLTWHYGRGGSAIRLPWGHYGPLRVEIEHTQAPGRALNLIEVTTFRQVQGEARGVASRREQKSPAGGREDARKLLR